MKLDGRKINSGAQEVIRILAVKAVIEEKRRHKEVCEIFNVTQPALSKWLREYRANGLKGLRAKRKGRPLATSRLKPLECAWIVRMITDKMPDQLKLPFYLWTTGAVKELIERKFNLTLSRWTVGRMLKRWGLTPQKPAKKSYFQKDSAVKEWLNVEYPKIKEAAKLEGTSIQWLDEMGARSDDQVGRIYGRKGQTSVVKIPGTRFSCNNISCISNYGELEFMMFDEKFTQDIFLKYLNRLIRSKTEKIYLILDSHPVHRGKRVQTWLGEHKDQITFYFLPSYSPELNPAEYLNQDVKSNAVRRKKAMNKKELSSNISSFLRSKKRSKSKVKSYFQAQHVKYAA